MSSRYIVRHATCDTSDCVNIGWIVESNETRARLTRRNRWQGSRDGVVYLADISGGPLTEEQAYDLAAELDGLRAYGLLTDRRGSSYRGFRCINAGWIVR